MGKKKKKKLKKKSMEIEFVTIGHIERDDLNRLTAGNDETRTGVAGNENCTIEEATNIVNTCITG